MRYGKGQRAAGRGRSGNSQRGRSGCGAADGYGACGAKTQGRWILRAIRTEGDGRSQRYGSGEAISDSIRAYDLPRQEAVPASAPLAMDGMVTALWSSPDGKSIFAAVESAANQFEVDRVTASCN